MRSEGKVSIPAKNTTDQERPYFRALNHLLDTGWRKLASTELPKRPQESSLRWDASLFVRNGQPLLLQRTRDDGFEVWFPSLSMGIAEVLAEVDSYAARGGE